MSEHDREHEDAIVEEALRTNYREAVERQRQLKAEAEAIKNVDTLTAEREQRARVENARMLLHHIEVDPDKVVPPLAKPKPERDLEAEVADIDLMQREQENARRALLEGRVIDEGPDPDQLARERDP